MYYYFIFVGGIVNFMSDDVGSEGCSERLEKRAGHREETAEDTGRCNATLPLFRDLGGSRDAARTPASAPPARVLYDWWQVVGINTSVRIYGVPRSRRYGDDPGL